MAVLDRLPLHLRPKFQALQSWITSRAPQGLLVTYSGGLDSGFLLWACSVVLKEGHQPFSLAALTTHSASLPSWDLSPSLSFPKELGVESIVLVSEEIKREGYAENTGSRCYHCKTELFEKAHQVAQERQLAHILYGYNASDRTDHRPGHQAAQEWGIKAPLDDCGFTKEDMREILHAVGISWLAEKPSSPCLASRVSLGTRVDESLLRSIDVLESWLRDHGLKNLRCRHHELDMLGSKVKLLRLEMPPQDMASFLNLRDSFVTLAFREGYTWVTLDLAGYIQGGAGNHVVSSAQPKETAISETAAL